MIYIITHVNTNNKTKIHFSTKAKKIADFILEKLDKESGFKVEVFEYGKQIPEEYK